MYMIYTITTNPSLDYHLSFDKELNLNDQNRSTLELFDAGGKGVNVSTFLDNLGIQSCCLGFLGGFTKDYYLEKLKGFKYIQPLFTTIKENTRINIKTDSNFSLNAKGPNITQEEFEKFFLRINRIYDTDYVVLSGNIQEELVDKILLLVESMSKLGVKIILDTDDVIIDNCLKFKPYLVKLNDHNSGLDENEIISKAKKYIEKGVKYVLYSSPINNNYYYISEDTVFKANRIENTTVSTGSGDSMIAGFLYSNLRGANKEESFKYAVACSCLLKIIDNTATRSDIDNAVKNINIESI